ncbi:hypothetical protein VIBNISOn1_10025 [Vibrio nigripulchritudo SOn1]|uniref:Uncharacterized protein n=1 Tax=Vibrio nigripulchritudo SOn1 TaxID=1238450 RepID=A0AAV2VI52_9VIBR|nr:hypothetical protein VIBNISOn1_10025 [Vibrio nigripulchritudo SOn1]
MPFRYFLHALTPLNLTALNVSADLFSSIDVFAVSNRLD